MSLQEAQHWMERVIEELRTDRLPTEVQQAAKVVLSGIMLKRHQKIEDELEGSRIIPESERLSAQGLADLMKFNG